jgi:hypothetical protein
MRGLFRFFLSLFLACGIMGIALWFLPRVEFEIRGMQFGLGRAFCLNAFGHQPAITWELRIDKTSVPLLRIPRACECSLCRAIHHPPK